MKVFLPLLGKNKRRGNNYYPPQSVIIREGVHATHFLKDDKLSEKVLIKRQTIRLVPCHCALVAQSLYRSDSTRFLGVLFR